MVFNRWLRIYFRTAKAFAILSAEKGFEGFFQKSGSHSKHRDFKSGLFKILCDQIKLQKSQMVSTTTSANSLLQAFTVVEELVKSCILDLLQEILSPQTAKKTIYQRRIADMAIHLEKQIVEGIKKLRCLAIQLQAQGLDGSKCVGVLRAWLAVTQE